MDQSKKSFNIEDFDLTSKEYIVYTKDFKEVDSFDYSSKHCKKYLQDVKAEILDAIDANPNFWVEKEDSLSDFKTVSLSCLLLAIAWRATYRIAFYPREGEAYIYMKAKEIFFVPDLMYQLFLLSIHARDISVVSSSPEENECIVGYSFIEKEMSLINFFAERIMKETKNETDKERENE